MNVVSIMAHQDDEMGCLGTLLLCRERGDRLSLVTVTDGSKGFVHLPSIDPAEAARIRHVEMGAVAERLGAEYINLREPDEFLFDTPEVRMKLIETMRSTCAELIFTHYSEDYNLDHTTVSSLVRHCAMQACLPVLRTNSEPLRDPPAIFMVAPQGPFVFPPTHFVNISQVEGLKVELLMLHASQEQAMCQAAGVEQGLGDLCRRHDSYWGEQAACAFAEAFTPMRARGAIKPYHVLP